MSKMWISGNTLYFCSLGAACKARATGKKGGVWDKSDGPITLAFLGLCKIYRAEFRTRIVTDVTYQKISDDLYGMGYDYSKEQLREKMRNLKRSFSEAKQGKNQGHLWNNFKDMSFIFDEPLYEEHMADCE